MMMRHWIRGQKLCLKARLHAPFKDARKGYMQQAHYLGACCTMSDAVVTNGRFDGVSA